MQCAHSGAGMSFFMAARCLWNWNKVNSTLSCVCARDRRIYVAVANVYLLSAVSGKDQWLITQFPAAQNRVMIRPELREFIFRFVIESRETKAFQ
jgi:hypothetical protein